MTSYVQKFNAKKNRYELIERGDVPMASVHYISPDYQGYNSPIDGRWVEGRKARREDLERHGCRPYEKGEKEDAIRRKRDEDRSFHQRLERTLIQSFN